MYSCLSQRNVKVNVRWSWSMNWAFQNHFYAMSIRLSIQSLNAYIEVGGETAIVSLEQRENQLYYNLVYLTCWDKQVRWPAHLFMLRPANPWNALDSAYLSLFPLDLCLQLYELYTDFEIFEWESDLKEIACIYFTFWFIQCYM